MFGDDAFHDHMAAGGGGGGEKRSRDEPVRNDRMAAAAEGIDPFDADFARAGAANFRPEHVEEVGRIHHFRIDGGVAEHGGSFGQHGGHHRVHHGARCDDIET